MAFSFVNYNGPALPQDPNVRRLIRQQAMKDVATERRMQGSYGQYNLLQYPTFPESGTSDKESPLERELPDDQRSHHNRRDSPVKVPPRRSEARGPQRRSLGPPGCRTRAYTTTPVSIAYPDCATTERFVLLQKLVPLTGLRLGIAKFSSLKQEIVHSRDLSSVCNIGSRKLAYLITGGYGQAPALRLATDCVIAKLRQVLQPAGRPDLKEDEEVLRRYTKALRALQTALDDETQRITPETLCATELLGLFELLDGTSESHSWMRHVGGAGQLIQVRGAHRFRTDFEMALLMAHIGPAVMEAFLNNKSCFLAEKGWKEIVCSAISNDDSFIDHKCLVLGLWSHLVTGPNKFKEVTDVILSPFPPPQHLINDIIDHLIEDRVSLVNWIAMAQPLLGLQESEVDEDEYGIMFPRPRSKAVKSDPDYINRLTLLGTYVVCRILKSRLLIAMDPIRFHSLEIECQHLARKTMCLRQVAVDNKSEGLLETLFMSQSTWIANGILETESSWGEVSGDDGAGPIEKWKFESWCRAMGRKFPQYAPDLGKSLFSVYDTT